MYTVGLTGLSSGVRSAFRNGVSPKTGVLQISCSATRQFGFVVIGNEACCTKSNCKGQPGDDCKGQPDHNCTRQAKTWNCLASSLSDTLAAARSGAEQNLN